LRVGGKVKRGRVEGCSLQKYCPCVLGEGPKRLDVSRTNFASEDIKRDMANEKSKFETIDLFWRTTMQKFFNEPENIDNEQDFMKDHTQLESSNKSFPNISNVSVSTFLVLISSPTRNFSRS